jgi:hypothetical protein
MAQRRLRGESKAIALRLISRAWPKRYFVTGAQHDSQRSFCYC